MRADAPEKPKTKGKGSGACPAVQDADAVLQSVARPVQDAGESALLNKVQEFRDFASKEPEAALDRTEQKVFDEWSKKEGQKDDVFSKWQRFSNANETHVIRHVFGGEPL